MRISPRASAKLIVIALAISALLIGAIAAILQSNRFKVWLLAEISQRSGLTVRAESFALRPPFAVVANEVEIVQTNQFHFNARQLRATIDPWSRRVDRLVIDEAKLAIDLDAFKKTSRQEPLQLALRELSVRNGDVTLKQGERILFALAKINLSAQDINLDRRSGLTLATELPQLNSTAEISMTGQPRDFAARIILRPVSTASFFSRKQSTGDLLQLNLKLRAPSGAAITALIDGKFQAIQWAGNQLTGALTAETRLTADFTRATFDGKVTLADFPASFPVIPWKIASGALSANFAGSYAIAEQLLAIESLRLSAPIGSATAEGQLSLSAEPTIVGAKVMLRDLPLALAKAHLPAAFGESSVAGSVRVSTDIRGPWSAPTVNGVVECNDGQLRASDWSVANFVFTAPFEWQDSMLRFKDIRSRANKIAYAPKGHWQLAAERFDLESVFDYQTGTPQKIAARLNIGGAKFNSPDNTRVGENLSLTGPVEFTIDTAGGALTLVGKVSAGSGELLWGKFFGDLKGQKPTLDLDADYLRADDRLQCRRCALNLASVGSVEASGTVDRVSGDPRLSVQATSKNFSTSGFFEFFLRETFNRQYPLLDKIAMAGQLSFDVRLDGTFDALSAAGELSLKGGELRAKSADHGSWRAGSIGLDLPLQLHLGANAPAASGAPRVGSLRIENLRFADQTVAPIATTLSLAHNALRFHQPLRLGIFGGSVEISELFWPDLLNDPKRLSFSAEAKRLRLEELTQALQWPRFSGTLTGSIPNIQASENRLSTRGEIHAELFGGRLRMNNLALDNPFSSLASLKLDAQLNDVQLEQLTQTFAFGRISGTLEGSIDNLILIDGQPSELSADLYSVERGGEQRISVEALNKITVLSSGEDAGALYGGLAGFFDSFRYSKLGVKMNLKNDRLSLRGVDSRAGQEMLVVGSLLPPTVNIVSHTQNIAFSELLRRLERINKTGKANVK